MWLSLLILITSCNFTICDDDFLTKFHQNEFKIKDYIGRVDWYNEKYVNHAEAITYKYNRTRSVTNGTINFKIDVDRRLQLLMQAYKLSSNEYRDFPVRFQIGIVRALLYDVGGINNIFACGNITKHLAMFRKNTTYFFCNFFADEGKYPPLIPTGRYNLTIQGIFQEHVLGQLSGTGEIYIPTKVPPPSKKKLN